MSEQMEIQKEKEFNEKKQEHAEHRKRIRAKFSQSPELMADHELIEMLLFYCIPRKNTNEEAHRLLDRFGSIKGVFDAEMPALRRVAGVGEQSALLLRLVSEIVRRYELNSTLGEKPISEKEIVSLKKYLISLFVGKQSEELYAVLFNAKGRHMCTSKVAEGHSMGAQLQTRELLSFVIDNNPASVILVHNHPGGNFVPSADDRMLTNAIAEILHLVGIEFIDHYIVADNECVSIEEYDMFYEPRRQKTIIPSDAKPDF